MNWGKIIFSALAAGTIILIISQATAALASAINPGYSVFNIQGMREMNDPVMALFFLHSFVLALAFSIAFHFFGKAFKGHTVFKRGMHFGLLMWMLITLPGTFLVFSSMDYGETFLLSNTFGQLVQFVFAGIAIAWIFAGK